MAVLPRTSQAVTVPYQPLSARAVGTADPGFSRLSGNPPVPRRSLVSSFPRKREPRDFSHLPPVHARGRPWAPAFAGATIGECCRLDYSLLRRESGVPRFEIAV